MAKKDNHADTTRAHNLDIGDDDLTDMERVEREHGFVFGVPTDHDNDEAPEVAKVSCSNPACPSLNRLVTIHADTVQPVRCGECHSVLYCDHEPAETVEAGGTIGAPTRTTREVCSKCGTVLTEEIEHLDPIPLTDLPASILDTPLDAPTFP